MISKGERLYKIRFGSLLEHSDLLYCNAKEARLQQYLREDITTVHQSGCSRVKANLYLCILQYAARQTPLRPAL